MPKRAEMRRAHRAAWKRWYPLSEDPDDRRRGSARCDWPGRTRQERRAVWRASWPIWLEESIRLAAEQAA